MLSSKTTSLCLLLALTAASLLLTTAVPLPVRDIPPRCAAAGAAAGSCAAAGEDSLLPHPADCELFLYCVTGEAAPVCRQCPAGLHFSPTEHVCASRDVAGCNSTLVPTTTSEPTTWPPTTTTMETTPIPWTTIF